MLTQFLRTTPVVAGSRSMLKPVARTALVSAVVAGALLCAQTANANVVSVDFSSNPLSIVPFDLAGVYLNLTTGQASTDDTAVPGWDINPYFTGTDGSQPARVNLYTPDFTGGIVVAGIIPSIPAQQLAIGATIGASSYYKNGSVNASSGSTDIHYIGFRFLNEATSVEDYGYLVIQQSVSPAVDGSLQILGWSYDDTGASITVAPLSAVPEPATYALFGAGALGLAMLRRRRSNDATAT